MEHEFWQIEAVKNPLEQWVKWVKNTTNKKLKRNKVK